MESWYKDGRSLDIEALADLLVRDDDLMVEFGDARFRFTADAVARQGLAPHGAPVVLTLRQLDAPDPGRAVYLVDFVDVPLDATGESPARPFLDETEKTARRAVRRYVAGGLLRQAQELIALDEVA